MRSYAETYLADAMENLGEMTHFATHMLGLTLEAAWQSFLASGYAQRFGEGSPDVIAGLSGAELAIRMLETRDNPALTTGAIRRERPDEPAPVLAPSLSMEYWCGWVLAYYQWESGRTFSQIYGFAPMDVVARMYPTFHEESELRFAEAMEELAARAQAQAPTCLQRQRKLAGFSQSQLARVSGVGIRAIQQYEQRAKDINKAQAESVLALARALWCQPEDILEPKSAYDYAFMSF